MWARFEHAAVRAHLESGASSWELFWLLLPPSSKMEMPPPPPQAKEMSAFSRVSTSLYPFSSFSVFHLFFSPASPLTVSSPFFFFSFPPFTYMHWDLTQSSWWFGFHIFFWNSFLLPLKKTQTTEALKALCKSLFLFMLGQSKIQNDSISQDHPIILQVHGSF